MAQKQGKIQPKYINFDSSFENIQANEAIFIKNYGFDINANAQLNTGTGNPSGEGQNEYTLTPQRSNVKLPNTIAPTGFNKNIGTFECINTRELYYFNANSLGNHGIYVISGDIQQWQKVIVNSKLNFSFEQENYIAEHRVRLRIRFNEKREIVEKHLIWTDANAWQGWVNVIAAIKTDGFNANIFPYWTLKQPHFDYEELIQYPTRPPMIAPEFILLPNTDAQKGQTNQLLNSAFEFCIQYINTDGRETTVSNNSIPLIVKTNEFLSNPDLISKRAELTIYAGSPLTEKIILYVRIAKKEQDRNSEFITWSDWRRYDIINKFQNCGDNAIEIIGTNYWLRKNPFANYSYDVTNNTIKYIFDNTLEKQIVPQNLFTNIQTSMPIKSVGLSDLGDSILLANNLYGYDNFSCDVVDKITADLAYKDTQVCNIPLRTVKVYAYLGARQSKNYFYSNVGYFYGEDTQMRFGGISIGFGDTPVVNIDLSESKTFDLTFADRSALICYAKGTPFYSVGEWYQVNNDFSLVKINAPLDGNNEDVRQYIFNTYNNSGFFVCQFTLQLPAGVYDLALGRHNVPTSEDWRGTSTYVMGIANSRVRTPADVTTPNILMVKPNAITTFSKEMQIDCTNGDIDVWGNGNDLFYVYVPSINSLGRNWKFTEGYFYEKQGSTVAVELFSYQYINGDGTDDSGTYTDKNGFYFLYSQHNRASNADVQFTYRLNCTYPNTFTVNTPDNSGWFKQSPVYLSDHNGGEVGFANYILLKAKITNEDGTIAYSNIGVSIKDGMTAYTNEDGEATLIIHNGQPTDRVSNVFVNAGGNFTISLSNCGYISPVNYNQANVHCQTEFEQVYPYPINLNVLAQTNEETSLKSNAVYNVAVVGADLAGRRGYANKIATLTVPSFCQIDEVAASYVKWLFSSGLGLPTDIKWLSFYITKSINYRKYIQWVGDKIEFIDSNGNVTTQTATAALVRITIDSLLTANINSNFSLLSTYQFVFGDKLRVYDNGEGQLFDTNVYGDVIDVNIQGSNYNQAAVNANLIPPSSNIVLTSTATVGSNPTTLYVKYDSRFDKLKDKTGFWIELYTPSETNNELPYFQGSKWFPVIGGTVAQFTGFDIKGNPSYVYPLAGNMDYWDTYFINRVINSNANSKSLSHPFESPNVTDVWGANLDSGGQTNAVNPDAKQMWYDDSTIKSDDFVNEGTVNGLATFRSENKKSFKGYWWGGIVAVKAVNSIVFFLCENDYFTTDYNFHYTYPNAQGVMIVNLDNGLSYPHQKIGDIYGCNYEHTSTIIFEDKIIAWHDQKNSCFVLADYERAKDVTYVQNGDREVGIKSYYSAKSNFIGKWNNTHDTKDKYDIIVGIDLQLYNLYITFRPRRNNSRDLNSFINNQRDVQINTQETFVYSIEFGRWLRSVGFAPESYGKVRGNLGNEMYSFASGLPYYHLNTPSNSFCTFYGIKTERVLNIVINDEVEIGKILQSISLDSNAMAMFVDQIVWTAPNSFSYIPINYFVKRDGFWFAPVLRNANSYPPISKEEIFRSMILDGGRVSSMYFLVRLVGDLEKLDEYQELNAVYFKYSEILQTVQK